MNRVVSDQFSLNPDFGTVGDAMHHVDEQISKRIDQFSGSHRAERREQGHPDCRRMTPQLMYFFYRSPAAVSVDDSKRKPVK